MKYSLQRLIFCFYTQDPEIKGELFLNEKKGRIKSYPFTFNLKNQSKLSPEQWKEEAYQSHRITYYQLLQERKPPGTAWFRHQANKAKKRLAEIQSEKPAKSLDQAIRPTRAPDQKSLALTMDLLSGGRAISENLQLDRDLPISSQEQNRTIPVSSVPGITIEEIPWEESIRGKKPELDPLASILPHDQHAVLFPSYLSMLKVIEEMSNLGTPILRLGEKRVESAQSKEKYAKQLCLPVQKTFPFTDPRLVSSLAITGGDPFFRTGTSITILFQTQQKQKLLEALAIRRQEARKKFPSVQFVQEKIPGFTSQTYQGAVSPDHSIQSFVTSFGDYVVVTNSRQQIIRIAEVFRGKSTSLASLDEFQFFRKRYPVYTQSKEDAFLMITDATIRRWCSPSWRIGASRRTRAASILSELQARHESGATLNAQEFPALEDVTMIDGNIQSSKYGNLSFLTSVDELNLQKITPAEKKAYLFFRDRYQSHWSNYFDPIAGQVMIGDKNMSIDLSILPLIGGTDYQQMMTMVGEVKLKPESGDPHPEALLHWITALDINSPRMIQFNNLASLLSPSLGSGALGWAGDSLSFYLDDSPFLQELQGMFMEKDTREINDYMEKQWGRIPLGLNIEVGNPFQMTAFLAGLRVWIEQTAPGMTNWSNHEHKGQGYVKISLGEAMQENLLKEGSQPEAIFYAPSAKLLTITLREEMLKRAIDRNLLRRKPDSPAVASTWGGKSTALLVSKPISSLFEILMGTAIVKEIQKKSWLNLYALNEWKIELNQNNPVHYHHKVWKTKLHCPGGGRYRWNSQYQTFESTVFGHPGNPKSSSKYKLFPTMESMNFGITFERDGVRAQATFQRPRVKD